ncbi:MAG: hypothetical protein IPK82_16865 [Polyangiaceae bacterium]|nr:hypothetical protein [Polyangiaceae bacterium]
MALVSPNKEYTASKRVKHSTARLAIGTAALLPLYFLAWAESHVVTRCVQSNAGPQRIVPGPENYLPVLAIFTVLMIAHFPTQIMCPTRRAHHFHA